MTSNITPITMNNSQPDWNKTRLLELWVYNLIHFPTPQVCNRLRLGDEYCCLGDLCRIANIPVVKVDENFYYETENIFLPNSLQNLLGLTRVGKTSIPHEFYSCKDYVSLAGLNDYKYPKPFIGIIIYYEFLLEDTTDKFYTDKVLPLIFINEGKLTQSHLNKIHSVVEEFKLHHYR